MTTPFIVIAFFGFLALAAVSHVARETGGAAAERRFWMLLGVGGLNVATIAALNHWIIPERHHAIVWNISAGLNYAVLSFYLVWNQPFRPDPPSRKGLR